MNVPTAELLDQWRRDPASPDLARAATKAVLADLAAIAPGRSVEVRVPPHGAVQVIAGPPHRRGTPKATVEMSPETLADLATGRLAWGDAVQAGRVLASGERADLAAIFPL